MVGWPAAEEGVRPMEKVFASLMRSSHRCGLWRWRTQRGAACRRRVAVPYFSLEKNQRGRGQWSSRAAGIE